MVVGHSAIHLVPPIFLASEASHSFLTPLSINEESDAVGPCVSSRCNCSNRQYQEQITSENLNRHYDSNQQYSITDVSDGGGSVAERYAYSAYGQVTIADGTGSEISISGISNRYTYTEREWDEALSLYHYQARMYDAVSGRFVSRDPIGFKKSPWLVYEYVYGRPLVKVAPSGLAGDCHENLYQSPNESTGEDGP